MTNIKKRHRKRGIKMRALFQIFTVIYHKKVRRIYLEKILVCVIILTIISELCACKKKSIKFTK